MRLATLLIMATMLAACSSPHRAAPIVDRTTGVGADVRTTSATSATATTISAGAPRAMDGHGYYTVKKGDTLLHIALDFGQNYRDLVTWNNLDNPNDIRVDQVLRVLPPAAGSQPASQSPSQAQAGSVGGNSVIEVRPLTTAAPAAAAVPNKSGPRADKQVYSEAALAEMQKPDTANTSSPALAVRPEPRVADRPADVAGAAASATAEDTAVSWVWPAEGKIVGTYEDGKKGIDISGKSGQPVLAAGAGKVMYAGSGIRGYGNLVIVKHTNNLLSAYAHNKTILVKEGQNVAKGEKIAEMGNTDTDMIKLHFEIRQQGKPVDPSKFLPTVK